MALALCRGRGWHWSSVDRGGTGALQRERGALALCGGRGSQPLLCGEKVALVLCGGREGHQYSVIGRGGTAAW